MNACQTMNETTNFAATRFCSAVDAVDAADCARAAVVVLLH